MIEIIYFTLAAAVLYVGSDWILNQIEKARGKRFRNRSLVFFVIILTLSLTTFNAINYLARNSTPADSAALGSQPQP